MLSPRRTKPDPVIVMYELRTVRALKPLPTMRVIESRIKKWRGLLRWTMQAFASPRGEAVVQIVGERQSQVAVVHRGRQASSAALSAAARHVPCCSAPSTGVVIAKMRAALLLYSANTPLALSYAHAQPKSYSQRRRAALSPVAQPHSPRLVTASVTSYVRLPRLRVALRE